MPILFGGSGDGPYKSSGVAALPQFPIYLLPSLSIPFRRRKTNSSTSTTASSPASYGSNTSALPSLASSPRSSVSGSPTSPTSPADYFEDKYFDREPIVEKKTKAKGAVPVSHSSSGGRRLYRPHPDTLRCNTCSTDVAFAAQIVSKGFTGRHGRAYLVSPPRVEPTPSCPGSPPTAASAAAGGLRRRSAGDDLVNVRVGKSENRQLVTGQHVVADISCAVCGTKLGWKYVDAREQAQKYKVGKFILETQRVSGHSRWEDVDADAEADSADGTAAAAPRSSGSYMGDYFEDYNRRLSRSVRSSTDTYGTAEEENGEGEEEEEIEFDSDDEDECEDIFAGVWDAEVVAKRRKGKVSNLMKKQGIVRT